MIIRWFKVEILAQIYAIAKSVANFNFMLKFWNTGFRNGLPRMA
jgi:hypothetical protein